MLKIVCSFKVNQWLPEFVFDAGILKSDYITMLTSQKKNCSYFILKADKTFWKITETTNVKEINKDHKNGALYSIISSIDYITAAVR